MNNQRHERIARAFAHGKAFIPFITGGDPSLEVTKKLLIAMEEAGADLVEIGLPFSDPIAEGEVIQEATYRALSAGCTTDQLFDMVKEARETVKIPLVFLTYVNSVFSYGKEAFMKRCVECGVDGLIVPDLPYEEKGEIRDVCQEYGIAIISLIAPTSKERIKAIAQDAQGFIYVVSSLGVTGVRQEITTNVEEMTAMVRQVTDVPCAIGFGISRPEQATQMARVSDGAIVGSAIVRMVGEYKEGCIPAVAEYVKKMKEAVRAAE
ncbi:MAG: tryptophan synthase subunit alpha [Lachnospiraceae bacterium]|nr:tryptophan synthase subunit alpha [Lachnospiraceae bacterium]MCI9546088.1 tryptophan synthase subunit alpha [Lachnospiraceae bacterium]